MARRYEFYFRVAKQYFTNESSEISSSRRVMFFLLYRQNDIDRIIEGNYQGGGGGGGGKTIKIRRRRRENKNEEEEEEEEQEGKQ